jgi:uncharacterized tellurite resistance protein B-like protein
MASPLAAHDRLARVIHLYLAVADTEGGAREPHERQLAIDLSCRWAPTVERAAVAAAVDTAYVAAASGLGPGAAEAAEELCRDLPPDACQRLLADLGLIARADGHLDRDKARVIAQVRTVMSAAPVPQA